jgi:hypothetical protein
MPNMKRWSDAKLEKEIFFAKPANDGSPESLAWIAALDAEAARRNAIDEGAADGDYGPNIGLR